MSTDQNVAVRPSDAAIERPQLKELAWKALTLAARALQGDRLTETATLGVGVAAAALSFANLMILAQAIGYGPKLAWLYPIAIDLYGLTATRVWIRDVELSDHFRSWAKRSSFVALGASVIGGALPHGFAKFPELVAWTIIPASALPAIMLGLAGHLLVLRRSERLALVVNEPPADVVVATAEVVVEDLAEEDSADESAAIEAGGAERPTTKKAALRELFLKVPADDPRSSSKLAEDLGAEVGMHPATARRELLALRRELDAAAESGSTLSAVAS